MSLTGCSLSLSLSLCDGLSMFNGVLLKDRWMLQIQITKELFFSSSSHSLLFSILFSDNIVPRDQPDFVSNLSLHPAPFQCCPAQNFNFVPSEKTQLVLPSRRKIIQRKDQVCRCKGDRAGLDGNHIYEGTREGCGRQPILEIQVLPIHCF